MKNKITICKILLFCMCISCAPKEKSLLEDLNKNIPKLNKLLEYLEANYRKEINSYKEFIDCRSGTMRFESSVCADEMILEYMSILKIDRIRFEIEQGQPVVYFWREKTTLSLSLVYYKYEYSGVGEEFRSQTIYYKPVDTHWSLYIDSSFP